MHKFYDFSEREKKKHNFFTFRPVVIIIKEKCFGLVRAIKSNRRNQHSYSLKPYLKLFVQIHQ